MSSTGQQRTKSRVRRSPSRSRSRSRSRERDMNHNKNPRGRDRPNYRVNDDDRDGDRRKILRKTSCTKLIPEHSDDDDEQHSKNRKEFDEKVNDDDSLGGLDEDEHDGNVENLVQTFMDMAKMRPPPEIANHSDLAEIPCSEHKPNYSVSSVLYYHKSKHHVVCADDEQFVKVPPLMIAGMTYGLRFYPKCTSFPVHDDDVDDEDEEGADHDNKKNDAETENVENSVIGIEIMNKSQVWHRVHSGNCREISVWVQCGRVTDTIRFTLEEVMTRHILFKRLTFGETVLRSHNNMTFKLHLSSLWSETYTMDTFAAKARVYEANRKFGSIFVHSCSSKPYKDGTLIGWKLVDDNNESTNYSNSEPASYFEPSKISKASVRMCPDQFAALGPVLFNMLQGPFKSPGDGEVHFVTNGTLEQIENVLYFAVFGNFHHTADLSYMAAQAQYLLNDEMQKKIVNCQYFKACGDINEFPKAVKLASNLRLSVVDGVGLLRVFFKNNFRAIKAANYNGHSMLDEIKQYPIVANADY